MSSDEFLGDRKKALEDSFFAKENERLLKRMRDEKAKLAAKDALAEASRIQDDAVLDACDGAVAIPMRGFIPSYNLQAAMGIVVGEQLRQQQQAAGRSPGPAGRSLGPAGRSPAPRSEA